MSSYWSQYKTKISLFDLYRTDGGLYYYNKGWNVIGMVILFLSTFIVLIGKFVNISIFKFLYESSYVFGLLISFVLYAILIKFENKGERV